MSYVTSSVNSTGRMLNINKKLKVCIAGNFVVLLLIVGTVVGFDDGKSKYWRIGPQKDFILISVTIDNWTKYYALLIFVATIKISQVFIAEIAHPIIGFNIYNPDKKVIVDFSKIELQIYGNLMYTIDSIRDVIMVVMAVSQMDVALWGVLCSEMASIFTIRMLLNEKSFKRENTY